MTRPVPVVGNDGETYYSVPEAATLLGVDADVLYSGNDLPLFEASTLGLAWPGHRGRPPKYGLRADAVDARRADLLQSLYAVDVRDVPAATGDFDVSTLRERVSVLEEVVRLSSLTETALIEQKRLLLGTDVVPPAPSRDGLPGVSPP